MVRLYIEGSEIELDKTVQFAITKQFEDLSNPTAIINDWSKTVSIPFTIKNHNIFGYIYRPDKANIHSNNSFTGIYFDPLRKLDFRLEWDGAILMTGYAKMNEIKQKNGTGTYEVTLFGQLGKLFQDMKKITFDNSTSETDYLINGDEYVDEYISKDLVYSSWTSTGQTTNKLKKIGQTGYKVTDIIGFAPNNAISEGFDYQSYQQDSSILKFNKTLGDSFANATGVNPDSAIPKGMMPREIGEYRSYLQLPYIYFNKLFQIFQEKSEALTGYTFNLHSNWFNDANPYWKKLVMMLKSFKVDKDDGTMHNAYTMRTGDLYWSGSSDSMSEVKTQQLMAYTKQEQVGIINATGVTPAVFIIPNKASINISYEQPMYIQSPTVINNSNILQAKLANGMLYLRLSLYNQNNEEIDYRIYKVRSTNDPDYDADQDTSGWPYNTLIKINTGDPTETTGSYYYWRFNVKDTFNVTEYSQLTHTKNESFYFKYEAKWSDRYGSPLVGNPVLLFTDGSYSTKPIYVRQDQDATVNMNISTELKRSFAHFTLNDLWNKDFNLFDVIINYCKMYRIYITIDEANKTINFIPHQALFSNYNILNWTDKVDKSNDFVIKPVTFDKKYVLFNYVDNKTYLGEEYKKKYGVNYGDYKVITDYNFNNETENLFSKTVIGSINNTDNVLSWTNIYDNHKIIYSFPPEIYIYNKNKDGKQVDLFGSFFFHNGIINFSNESALALRPVKLSDDSATQVHNNTYCYSQSGNDTVSISRAVYQYPKLEILSDNNFCTFNIPSENYTYLQNYSNKNTIFSNFWETYINERYNVQNKLVTCYIKLSPKDFVNFKWNNFILIDDTLYLVNKIYDYDITTNNSTKVDLITVYNINGYNDDSFFVSIDNLVLHFLATSYLDGNIMANPTQLGTFETGSDVTFADGTKTYSTNGVTFTIVDNAVYYQSNTKYVDKEDADFNVTLKNNHYTASFHCVRYSTYPYPEIKLYESDGVTERSTIYPGTRNYKLAWYGTETYGLENKPTVTIENHGIGSATINTNTWVENQVMIAEGDDEWLRIEYVVDFNTNMTNYSGTYVRVTMVDKEGWHDTRDFPVSI